MPAKTAVFVCPTTHWDREWVMTFGQFRVRLVNLVDRLLGLLERHPDYKFYLDGQAAVLDDYLEIKPENRDRIAGFMRQGRLAAGPWYVLADQFLQCGEATIRNLTMGMETVRGLGGEPEMLGYVPDSFGSTAGLPMILRGFGITAATFGRGRPYWGDRLPNTEFRWRAPDGSEVLAIHHGYGNGLFLSYPDIWSDIFAAPNLRPDPEKALETFLQQARHQAKAAATPGVLYFSVGADHMEPREPLVELLDFINARQDEYALSFATPGAYARAVEAAAPDLISYTGELYGADDDRIWEGTLTGRIQLKQMNDQCGLLLASVLEPLYAALAAAGLAEYPQGHLRDLWKKHILNHPHDSICGCGIDSINREIRGRYEHVLDTGAYLEKEAMRLLADSVAADGRAANEAVPLVVANPAGHARGGRVKKLVRVPRRMPGDAFSLADEDGKDVPAVIRRVAEKSKDLESAYMTNAMLASVLSKDAKPEKPDDQV